MTATAPRSTFDKSAGKLGVDRLDLLIQHQPLPSRFDRTLEPTGRWPSSWPMAGWARSG